MRKVYDTWMDGSKDERCNLLEAGELIKELIDISTISLGDDWNLRAFEFIGCAARVQIECRPETIEIIKAETNRKWEESREWVKR